MRNSILLLTLLVICDLAYSQTTCEGLWFSSQEEVDQFAIDNPDCTEVDAMVIEFSGEYWGIYDLSPLSNITTIQGALEIFNHALYDYVSTEAFANLTSVGSLYIENVNDPDGFINLTNVTGNLTIFNGYAEGFEDLSLDGFSNLQSAGSINLCINNPEGDYLNVFPNLVSLGNLHLGGWQGSGGFQMQMNVNTLNGFNQVTFMDAMSVGILSFGSIEEIDNFEILNSLESIGTLTFDILLTEQWNSFTVLQSIDSFYCLSGSSDVIDFPSVLHVGDFFVWLDGIFIGQDYSFPFLETVDYFLVWEWNLTTTTNTSNTSELFLPALQSVNTHFEISGNQQLSSGPNNFPSSDYDFSALTYLANLYIIGTNLQSLELFENLDTIEGPVEISMNSNLTMCSIEAMCEKISSSVNLNDITITSNNLGCNSITEVVAACTGNYITGTVYADVDCNQTLDANDIPIDFAMITDENDAIVAASSSTGYYLLAYDPLEITQIQINREAYLPTGLLNITPAEPFGLITNDIFVCPDYAYHNVSILCNAMSPARPGFAVFYDITITNHSANIETLSTIIDLSDLPNYTLVECDGCQENGTYLEYADQELNAFENIQLTLVLQVPQNVAIGSEWDISGYIATSADNQNNVDENAFENHQLVVASYDPNDIAVDRSAINFENYNTNGEWLNYQIRFQNTGNYPAEFINVLNGLDDELDMNTLQIIETSHDAQLFFNENRELEFFFDNIQLPDSTSDPEGSNGFIRYRIKTNEGLNLSSYIESTAAIYFDYNEPVITNTASTEFYVCPASLHPSGGIDICYDAELMLEADAGWETYQWSVNGNAVGTATSQDFEGLNEGPNNVVVEATTEFCEASVAYEIFLMDEVEMPVIIMEWDEISVTIGGIIEWFLNGELIASDLNALVIEEPGDYTAVRTFGDCSSTSAVFTVTDVPQCEAPIVAPYANSVCSGASIEFMASGDYDTFEWSLEGSQVGQGNSHDQVLNDSGTHLLELLAESEFCTWTLQLAVIVNPTPVVPIISQNGLTLEVTDNGGMIEWYLNGEVIASDLNALVIEEPGDYTAVRTFGDCSSTSAVFVVTDVPQCEAPVVAPYANSVCSGASIEFMASGDYDTFEWSLEGSQVGQGNSYVQVLNDSGTHLFELLAESEFCTWTLQLAVIVNPAPAVPIISQNGLTLEVTDNGGMIEWYLNGEVIASDLNALVIEEPGDYTAVRTIGDCSSTSAVFVVTDVPQCEAPVVAPYANSVCSGASIEFMASGDYDTFEWSLEGSQVGQGNSYVQVLNDSGTHLFELLAESEFCTWTLQLAVIVNPTPVVPIISQNGLTLEVTDNGGMIEWYLNGEVIASDLNALVIEEPGDYLAVRTMGDCSSTSAVFVVTDVPQCEAPVVADYPSSICSGEIIELSASGAYNNFSWSLEGNPVGQGYSLSQVMPSSGTHFFELLAESQYCTWTLQVPVVVNPTPALPVITQNGQMLEVTGNGGMFEWFLNGSFIGSNGNTLAINEGGDYVVVSIVGSCSSTSNTFTVENQSLCEEPELLPYPASICAGESMELAVLGEYDSFLWYNGLEEVGQGENISTVMMNEGNYAFSLLAINPTCSWTLEFSVVVNETPSNPVVTQNDWTLEASGEGDYTWTINGVEAGSSASVDLWALGTYTVTSTIGGCTSAPVTTNIDACSGTIILSGNANACQDDVSMLEFSNAYLSYVVVFNEEQINAGTSFALPTEEPGLQMLGVVGVGEGCLNSEYFDFSVQPTPPTCTITQSGNVLTATGVGAFTWTLDGMPLTETGSILEMTQSGEYGVAVILAGCMSEWTAGFYTYTSVEELENNNVVVYPNPAMDNIQIKANRLSATDVLVLINAEGQIIELNKSEVNIDVSGLARGLYLLQSRDTMGAINWQERLILQ